MSALTTSRGLFVATHPALTTSVGRKFGRAPRPSLPGSDSPAAFMVSGQHREPRKAKPRPKAPAKKVAARANAKTSGTRATTKAKAPVKTKAKAKTNARTRTTRRGGGRARA